MKNEYEWSKDHDPHKLQTITNFGFGYQKSLNKAWILISDLQIVKTNTYLIQLTVQFLK